METTASPAGPRRHCTVATALLCCFTTGCVSIPNTYAPPVQRKPLTGPDPGSLKAYVRMNESGAEAHLLKDVNTYVEGAGYRWTKQNPTLEFQPAHAVGEKLRLDFGLHSEVLQKTGPITLTISINGKVFDRATFDREGEHHYEKPVPPEYLTPGASAIVAISLDKVLDTPDGNKLGLILTGAGFTE